MIGLDETPPGPPASEAGGAAGTQIGKRYVDASGETRVDLLRDWIRDHRGEKIFPDRPWLFAGSGWRADPRGGPDRYNADLGGSVVGLVTFGDELIGWVEVLPDAEDVWAPEWEIDVDRAPPMGTEVTLVLRPGSG